MSIIFGSQGKDISLALLTPLHHVIIEQNKICQPNIILAGLSHIMFETNHYRENNLQSQKKKRKRKNINRMFETNHYRENNLQSHMFQTNHCRENNLQSHMFQTNHYRENNLQSHMFETNHCRENNLQSHMFETNHCRENNLQSHMFETNHCRENNLQSHLYQWDDWNILGHTAESYRLTDHTQQQSWHIHFITRNLHIELWTV
ncbi:hypothetical protein ACJX0J_022037, partial [Zea mays]